MVNEERERASSTTRARLSRMLLAACGLAALIALVGVDQVDAQVPPGGEQVLSNTYVITDSDRDQGLLGASLDLRPTSVIIANAAGQDDAFATVTMPFAFQFLDWTLGSGTSILVSSNGVIFAQDPGNLAFSNLDLTDAAAPAGVIAPLWDDFNPVICGEVRADTFGVAPNRVFVVEWTDVCDFGTSAGSTDGYTFQARLLESSNAIEFHYLDVTGAVGDDNSNLGASATIGARGLLSHAQYSLDGTPALLPEATPFVVRIFPCSTATPTVSTAAELDNAILCYNNQTPPGDHTITLDADISHPTGAPTINSSTDTTTLTIDGNGNTLTANGDVRLFDVDNPGAFVSLRYIWIDGAREGVAVRSGAVDVVDSSFTSNGTAIELLGFSVDEAPSIVVANTRLTGNQIGVNVLGAGRAVVRDSDLSNGATGANASLGGSIVISNTTVAGNLSGVIAESGTTVALGATTIHNNFEGLVLNGPISVTSSMIAGNFVACQGPSELTGNLATVLADDPSCGTGVATLTGPAPLPLLDNGCNVATPIGCVLTVELPLGSNAIGAGDCGALPISLLADGSTVAGPVEFDQRGTGFPRTIGANCDAGAFEANVCTTATPMVSTATELDDAIACYNNQTPPEDHTITLGADISHPTTPPAVTGPATLSIDGNGRGLDGAWDGLAGAIPGRDLLRHTGSGTLSIVDLDVGNSENHGLNVTDGTVELDRVSVSTLPGNGIRVEGETAAVVVSNSFVSALDDVVYLENGRVTVRNSVLTTSDGVGVVGFTGQALIEQSEISAPDGVHSYGTTMIVVNSTVDGGGSSGWGVASITGGDVRVVASTISGFAAGLEQGSSSLSVTSSIITDNEHDCGGNLVPTELWNATGSPNFTGDSTCPFPSTVLSPPDSLGQLAPINGCQTEVFGGGCVATRDLSRDSNAIGAGDCTNVEVGFNAAGELVFGDVLVDQRGEPRDPATCDAGAFELPCLDPGFVDVPAGAFYDDAVTWAYCNNITTGTSTTTFSPTVTVNRAQLATFLWRYAGQPTPAGTNPFTDVPAGSFFETPVTWLAETGITTGTSATTFSPNNPVTRAQLATFLWRYAGQPTPAGTNPFTDVPTGSFYETPVTWLAQTGITTGTSATTFTPNNPVTRAQAVTFLYRYNDTP